MNEIHENEFKSFSKTFVFNLELQKQDFQSSKTQFLPTLKHILHQTP